MTARTRFMTRLRALVLPVVLLPSAWAPIQYAGGAQSPAETVAPVRHTPEKRGPVTGLHARGDRILNSAGWAIRLLGVNRGAASACVQNWSIFSGPTDAGSVRAMVSWGMNAVRIPLNEDCWLGVNQGRISSAYYGARYRQAVKAYVTLLSRAGIAPILDLHWSAPGSKLAENQQPMPDADHAPAFWRSVAATFKANRSVIFDLYNEPYPDNNGDSRAAWQCWLRGCEQSSYTGAHGQTFSYGWGATGMQSLIDVVRSTGARNMVVATGIGWGGVVDRWLQYEPRDPAHNLAAGIHIYPGTWCHDSDCWDRQIAPVARTVPLIVGEFGEPECSSKFTGPLMAWLDRHGASYLAWHWWTVGQVGCANFPLIMDYGSGSPSSYGLAIRNHIAHAFGFPAVALPTPVRPDTRSFSWEDGGLDGWTNEPCGGADIVNSTRHAYAGKHALAFRFIYGAGWPCVSESSAVATLQPGATLSAFVFVPVAGSRLSAHFLTCGRDWQYAFQEPVPLRAGWTRLTWTVPAQPVPVRCLGLKVDNPSGWRGEVDLDAVHW